MAYDRILVLAASQDETLAFGRAFALDVQHCTGAHNLFGARVIVELESFADARKFQIQTRLGYWDQEPHNIHMYVADADWNHERAETAPPTKLRTDGYPVFHGIQSTGDEPPSARGTNAQRQARRALPEPQLDEEDELMVALEGGKRREPETTGKYVVQLDPAEVAARKATATQQEAKPEGRVVSVVEEGSDEARWDDNGGAGRPDPKPEAPKRRTRKTAETPPVAPAPPEF